MRTGRTISGGFTLVEIMIVVAIIGLLVALALPSFVKARHESQKNTFINDLRIAVNAFQTYNLDHKGQYPPNSSPGVLPPLMQAYLTRFPWASAPTIGGQWDWDYNTNPTIFIAGISVRNPSWSDADMMEIDAAIDDGNLNTGSFRKINTDYTSIIE